MKLKLYSPLKEYFVNQPFGVNDTPVYAQLGMKGHNGIDLRVQHGDPIYASHDGYASFQIDSNGGHGVVVITNQKFEDVNGVSSLFKTIYWHMADSLKEPQFKSPIEDKTGFVPVKAGDLIGYADNTGLSTGDHLHFGLKTVAEGESWGSFYNTNQNNGYFGAIDPAPYLVTQFVPFKNEMKYGDYSEDVKTMQAFFLRIGQMQPIAPEEFGHYGPRTERAVKDFMVKSGKLSWSEKTFWYGQYTGPKTLATLNEQYQ